MNNQFKKTTQEIIKSIKKKNSKGFTLIEVVLTTMVVSLVFIALYSLISISYKGYVESRYEVIAAGLAQESIEMVRNYRDEAFLNNSNYAILNLVNECGTQCAVYVGIDGGVKFKKDINIHNEGKVLISGTVYTNCINGGCSNSEPNFERVVKISPIAGDNRVVSVQVTVSWNSFLLSTSNSRKEIVVESILSEWLK